MFIAVVSVVDRMDAGTGDHVWVVEGPDHRVFDRWAMNHTGCSDVMTDNDSRDRIPARKGVGA